MLLFGGSQLSFFFPMLHFGGPQLLLRSPMLFALACCCTQALLSTFPSTKSGFLCAFGVWNPRFRAFRAQNRGCCALVMETLASGNRKARKFFVFARCWSIIQGLPLLWLPLAGVLAQTLLPESCRRSVAAGALPPKRYCRSVTARALLLEKLRLRVISPPRSLRRLLRRRFCRRYGRCRSGRLRYRR